MIQNYLNLMSKKYCPTFIAFTPYTNEQDFLDIRNRIKEEPELNHSMAYKLRQLFKGLIDMVELAVKNVYMSIYCTSQFLKFKSQKDAFLMRLSPLRCNFILFIKVMLLVRTPPYFHLLQLTYIYEFFFTWNA